MKKNAVGNILYHQVPIRRRISIWSILARFLCLLLALVMWLIMANANKIHTPVEDDGVSVHQESV